MTHIRWFTRYTLVMILLANCASNASAAITIGSGATLQPSFFGGGTIYTGGAPGFTFNQVRAAELVDGKAGRGYQNQGFLEYFGANTDMSGTAFLQAQAAAPFTVGTVIHTTTMQGTNNFDAGEDYPFAIKLGATTIDTSPGDTSINNLYELVRIPSISTDTVRVEFAELAFRASDSRHYAGVSEILVLPKLGDEIPIDAPGITDDGSFGGFPGTDVADFSGNTGFYDTASPSIVTLNLGDPISTADSFAIASLFLSAFDGVPTNFNILASTNGGSSFNPLVTVVDMAAGDLGLLNLTSVATGVTHLRLEFPAGQGDTGLSEITPFAPVPEPSSLIYSLISLAIIRYRCQKRSG